MNVAKETYVAFLLDRQSLGPVMIASSEGGMDIEAVAHSTPEKIHRLSINPDTGLSPSDALKMAEKIGFTGEAAGEAAKQFVTLYNIFWSHDATLVGMYQLFCDVSTLRNQSIRSIERRKGHVSRC